jgi:hypothetical protein
MAFNSSSPPRFLHVPGLMPISCTAYSAYWGNMRQSAYGSNEYPATLMSALGHKQTFALQ